MVLLAADPRERGYEGSGELRLRASPTTTSTSARRSPSWTRLPAPRAAQSFCAWFSARLRRVVGVEGARARPEARERSPASRAAWAWRRVGAYDLMVGPGLGWCS